MQPGKQRNRKRRMTLDAVMFQLRCIHEVLCLELDEIRRGSADIICKKRKLTIPLGTVSIVQLSCSS